MNCYYVSLGAQTLAWTHLLPTIIPLALWAASLNPGGKQWLLGAYGWYLFAWQFALWAFQESFKVMRPDPYCAQYHTYAFPSQEGFYVSALVTFVIAYAYLWNIPMSVLTWLFMFLFFIAPPAILVWFSYNRWWEVLFSMGLGIVATVPFILVIRIYITPLLPYILNQAPWTWFSYNDTYCLNNKKLVKYVGDTVRKCERVIAADAHGRYQRGSRYSRLYVWR